MVTLFQPSNLFSEHYGQKVKNDPISKLFSVSWIWTFLKMSIF